MVDGCDDRLTDAVSAAYVQRERLEKAVPRWAIPVSGWGQCKGVDEYDREDARALMDTPPLCLCYTYTAQSVGYGSTTLGGEGKLLLGAMQALLSTMLDLSDTSLCLRCVHTATAAGEGSTALGGRGTGSGWC